MSHIKNVAIVGGTHGNEVTGPYLLRRWQHHPEEIKRPSFSTRLCLGNPKAFKENRRFVDEDLNRCFARDSLQSRDSPSYEAARASVLNYEIGPKGSSKYDFVIDIHTSTSNCGAMLVLSKDDVFSIRLAAYIQGNIPETRIHHIPSGDGDPPFLGSLVPRSLGVETGPIPQGVLRYDIFELTRRIVMSALDFAHNHNSGLQLDLPKELTVFKTHQRLKYPMEDGYLAAMIHESLQGRDYEPLNPGDPLFRCLDGSLLSYEGARMVYPVFINEAAYYREQLAMVLTTKETLRVPGTDVANA